MEWFRERKWTSDRVCRVMQKYSIQFSGQELNISAWRHIAIGISNRYFNKVFGDSGDEFDDDGDGDGDGGFIDSILVLQSKINCCTIDLIYPTLQGVDLNFDKG
jgi:hypothetical protein